MSTVRFLEFLYALGYCCFGGPLIFHTSHVESNEIIHKGKMDLVKGQRLIDISMLVVTSIDV